MRVFLALVVLAVAGCSGEGGTDARVPIDAVEWALEPAPQPVPSSDLSAWLDGQGCTADGTGRLDCPALAAQFGCQDLIDAGAYAAWLDAGSSPIYCTHWCQDVELGACTDGLVQHHGGMIGAVIDYLLVLDDGVPTAIRSPADFVTRWAPVESEGEALAFVTFLVSRVEHRFWPPFAGYNPSDVSSWQQVVGEDCALATIEGTRVEAKADGWRVSTFRGPDWNGCTTLALERLVVTVSRAGEVLVESSSELCWGQVPCYD